MTVTQSEQIDQLAAALAKVQAQLKPAIRDSANPFFKSKYADLGAVWDACRDALAANGCSVLQFPGFADGTALLTTVLVHTSGQWMQGTAGAPLVKADAQGVGSCISYLRRYALAAVVGVVTEDDDGEGAVRGKQSAGSGRSSAGKPKELPDAPRPVQSLDERPKQLTPEPKAPWDELTVNRDMPCPLDPKQRPVSGLRRNQLKFVEAYLDAHPDYPKADEWRIVVQKELASA